MGTSSSYGGPKGQNPLLPPWAEDPSAITLGTPALDPDFATSAAGAETNQTDAAAETSAAPSPTIPLPTISPWRGAKIAMRAVATGGAHSGNKTRKLGRRFVNALGGSRRATASSARGRETAQRLGGFLAAVAREGIASTLDRLGLKDYVGRPVSSLLVALGRVLAPSTATTEDAIAAAAFHETLASLVEDLGIADGNLADFDKMDDALIRSTMERYVSTYVVTRLLEVLTTELEGGAVSPERAVNIEYEIRDYVESATALAFGDLTLTNLNWESELAKRTVDRLFREGYEIFGGAK